MAHDTPLFQISNVEKRYGDNAVLRQVNLDLRAGEVHALMGENGAGKSTLIKILAGVVRPDRALIQLNGQPFALHSPHSAFAGGLRFIHQELNSIPQLSVAENIFVSYAYPRRWGGLLVDWRRLYTQTAALLAELGIRHINVRETMSRLSPGDQMLVKIAAAFMGEQARIYVMDEPTAALSRQESDLLFAVIRRLRERGCAVLYVSHRLDDIFQLADRVTVLRDGQVVLAHPLTGLTPPQLIEAMTGRALQQFFPPRTAPLSHQPLLTVQNLRTAQLGPLSFTLHAGEILGIAGLVGAGRTTLLRALIGAERRRGGKLHLLGHPLTHQHPRGGWQAGLAFVPEERRAQALVLAHSIARNIALPHWDTLRRGGLFSHSAAEHRHAHTLGQTVRLKAQHTAQGVRELSGGNQQKVVFARAAVRQPAVLLLDEPTRGVDVGAKSDLYQTIRQLSAAGTGVLVASSDLLELIGLCDRLLILRGGQLAESVLTAGLSEKDLLALCYGDMPHHAV